MVQDASVEHRQRVAEIIDGTELSRPLRAEIARQVAALREERGITPGLAVVIVGQDPASEVYGGSRSRASICRSSR